MQLEATAVQHARSIGGVKCMCVYVCVFVHARERERVRERGEVKRDLEALESARRQT